MSKTKSFVLHLDCNEGFDVQPSKNYFDVEQENLNGIDGCNLAVGEAKYAVSKEELIGIIARLTDELQKARYEQ